MKTFETLINGWSGAWVMVILIAVIIFILVFWSKKWGPAVVALFITIAIAAAALVFGSSILGWFVNDAKLIQESMGGYASGLIGTILGVFLTILGTVLINKLETREKERKQKFILLQTLWQDMKQTLINTRNVRVWEVLRDHKDYTDEGHRRISYKQWVDEAADLLEDVEPIPTLTAAERQEKIAQLAQIADPKEYREDVIRAIMESYTHWGRKGWDKQEWYNQLRELADKITDSYEKLHRGYFRELNQETEKLIQFYVNDKANAPKTNKITGELRVLYLLYILCPERMNEKKERRPLLFADKLPYSEKRSAAELCDSIFGFGEIKWFSEREEKKRRENIERAFFEKMSEDVKNTLGTVGTHSFEEIKDALIDGVLNDAEFNFDVFYDEYLSEVPENVEILEALTEISEGIETIQFAQSDSVIEVMMALDLIDALFREHIPELHKMLFLDVGSDAIDERLVREYPILQLVYRWAATASTQKKRIR